MINYDCFVHTYVNVVMCNVNQIVTCFSLQDVYRGLPGGQQALPGLRQPRAQDQAAPQTQVPDRVTRNLA